MKKPAPHLRAIPSTSNQEPPRAASGTSHEPAPADVPVARVKTQRTFFRRAGRLLLLLAISIVAASLVGPRLVGVELPVGAEFEGQTARVHVRAERDYVVFDEDETQALRAMRERESRSVWDLDLARAQADARHIANAFMRVTEGLRSQSVVGSAPEEDGTQTRKRKMGETSAPDRTQVLSTPNDSGQPMQQLRARLAGDLALIGVEAPRDAVWLALQKVLRGHPEARERLIDAIRNGLSRPVVEDRRLLSRDAQLGIVIRPVPSSLGQDERVLEKVETLPDIVAARRAFQSRLRENLWSPVAGFSLEDAQKIAEWGSTFLRSTLTYNAAESAARRAAARASAPEKTIRVFRGEMVLHPGELITRRHLLVLAAMDKQQGEEMRARAALGSGAFVLLLCWFVYRFGVQGIFRRSLDTRDLWVLGGILNLTLLMIYLADQMIVSRAEAMLSLAFDIPPLAVVCIVPIAWGAMQVRLLMSAELALLFAILLALLGGGMAEPGTTWTLVSLVSSLTAVALVGRMKRRLGVLICGVAAGGAAGLTATTLEVFRGAMTEEQLLVFMLSVTLGGGLSGVLTALGTPLAEIFLGYETRLRLIALADANQPLLKDLLVHAPGTWMHSVRTASLAEAACMEIGADAALVRVMALYHDIGKISDPQFYAENREGATQNESLSDEERIRIARDHVEEGRRIAKNARLPRAVVRAIASHHGQMPIEGAEIPIEPEADPGAPPGPFVTRFEGPLPVSRESAVLVLADQLERALHSANGRSQLSDVEQVSCVLTQIQKSGALDAAALTFHDMERIRAAFVSRLPDLPQLTRRIVPDAGAGREGEDAAFER